MFRLICLCSFLAMGCSVRKLAIDEIGPALSESSDTLQFEKNWDFFSAAMPGSLQLMQALLYSSPNNPDLLASLTKGFSGYGFIVPDTLGLKDRLAQSEESPYRFAAVQSFSQSLSYGLRYLELKSISTQMILELARDKDKRQKTFDNLLDPQNKLDRESMFYSGLAWLMLANYNRDKMALVGQLSAAYSLIEWTCGHEPDFQKGLCPALTGVYHLARPKMLGGKPEEAKKVLSEACVKYPENYLIPAMFMEWYLLPFGEKDAYLAIKNKTFDPLKELMSGVNIPGEPATKGDASLNLFNAMALKRIEMLSAAEKSFF